MTGQKPMDQSAAAAAQQFVTERYHKAVDRAVDDYLNILPAQDQAWLSGQKEIKRLAIAALRWGFNKGSQFGVQATVEGSQFYRDLAKANEDQAKGDA